MKSTKQIKKVAIIMGSQSDFPVMQECEKILKILNETYSSSIGVEFLHIQSLKQKQWVQERIEEVKNKTNFTMDGKKGIFNRLTESELFACSIFTKKSSHFIVRST